MALLRIPRVRPPLALLVAAVVAPTVPPSLTPEHTRAAHRSHRLNAAMHAEHGAVLRLADTAEATAVAARSGSWMEPRTWRGLRPPGAGGKVWIPAGVTVTLEASLLTVAYTWVRVDGSLRLAHDRDTGLKAVTVVVTEGGRLDIGSPHRRVRPDRQAIVEFADRGPRDGRGDPLDLTGGLIAQGSLRVYGADKVGHVSTASAPWRGSAAILLAEAARGWQAGDRVVVPGTNARADEDEVVPILGVHDGGRRIVLTEPLRYTHLAPPGADLPIGNLTRNVVFRSERRDARQSRGHVMVMHAQTGTEVEGAAFLGLGRTDTRIAHTVPALDEAGRLVPGTDHNTIGRYALHFHMRRDASRHRPPHRVRNSVIVDSPKHGLVNHGGHLRAEGNVTFRVDGSHFFAENGAEIGAFEDNLAIRSAGSELGRQDDASMVRMYVQDFGHGGYGYWLQGAGMALRNNYAFGHRAGGYAVNGHPMREAGRFVSIHAPNLANSHIPRGAKFRAGDLPLVFIGNQAGACFNGLDLWYSQIHATHELPSVVQDSFFWGLARHGVSMPYTRNVTFRNVTVLGSGQDDTSFAFGNVNDWGEAMVFENVRAEGFAVGIDLPTKGTNRITGARLANKTNIRVRNGPGADLDVDIREVTFASFTGEDVRMEGLPEFTPDVVDGTAAFARMLPLDGDLSPLFGRVRVRITPTGETRTSQIYFREQAAQARPFEAIGIRALVGRTTREAWDTYGVAIGGAVAPAGTEAFPRIVGLIGPPIEYGPRHKLVSDRFVRHLAGYVPRFRREEDGVIVAGRSRDLRPGWNVLRGDAGTPSVLVFGDSTPPVLEMDAGFSGRIHPADLRFGLVVRGSVVDRVGATHSRHLFVEEVGPLTPGPDGLVRLQFPIQDAAGNRTQARLAVRVTENAVRRGANSIYYRQGVYSRAALAERVAPALR